MRTDESITVGVFGRLFGRKLMMPITPANRAMTSMMDSTYRRLETQRQLQLFQRLADRVTISLRQLRDDEIFPPLFFLFERPFELWMCEGGGGEIEERQVGGMYRPEV